MTPARMDAFEPTPEIALLLAGAGARRQEGSTQLRQLAQQPGLDWERLLQLAERHALRPVLYRKLRQECAEIVPGPVLERLSADAQANAERSLRLTAELLRILVLLQEHDIRAIPYKGPVLSSEAYGDPGQREFLDLDILLPAADIPRARDALSSLGYLPALPLNSRQERALLRFDCEYAMHHPERRCAVELHWAIVPRQFAVEFDFEELWARRRQITLGGAAVSTLADEDLLLILALHAAKHLWECLCWTCDVAELLRARPGMDWQRLLSQAEKLGALRFLLISLELSHELLGAELPAAVRERIAGDPEVESLALAVIRRMWSPGGAGMSLSDHRLLLRARERSGDKLRYMARLVFTPGISEWQLLRLPAPLWPLYPAIRLGRVAGKLLRGLWRHSASASAPAPATPLNPSPPPPRA